MIFCALGWLLGTAAAVAYVLEAPVNDTATATLIGMGAAAAGGLIGWAVDLCRG